MPSAARIMQRCDALARHSELAGGLTRVFLSREYRSAMSPVDAGAGARTLLRSIERFEPRR